MALEILDSLQFVEGQIHLLEVWEKGSIKLLQAIVFHFQRPKCNGLIVKGSQGIVLKVQVDDVLSQKTKIEVLKSAISEGQLLKSLETGQLDD